MKVSTLIVVALCAFPAAAVRAQIPATVTNTRMIVEQPDGKPDTTIVRTISSRAGTRSEHSGGIPGTGNPNLHSNIEIMSFADSDMTMTMIDTTRRIYAEMKPGRIMGFAMDVSKMKMESTDGASTLDSLGAGPVINGHNTLHFRTRHSSTMTMTIFADTSKMTQLVTADLYLAPDINSKEYDAEGNAELAMHAVQGMIPPGMQSMIAGAAKNRAVLLKYGMPLRTVMEITQTSAGGSKTRRQTIEIIDFAKTTVPASLFLPPAGYKKVGLMDFVQLP